MRIVVANIRYFLSGGPERYMFNIIEALEEKGHEVIPFSVKHNLNKPSEYSRYFLEPIGNGEEVYFKNYKRISFKDIFRIAGRLFYSFEARRKLTELIGDVKPDLVYILYFENKMSPSIISAAKKSNLPVVVRISDFGMICADNIFYLYESQKICEKCLINGKRHLVFNKCFHKSLPYSLLKYFSYILHDFLRIYENVDAFIIPSKFTIGKFTEYGIKQNKIFHIPTFFNLKNKIDSIEYGDFALYFGRIDQDKGIKIMVDAFVGLDYKLTIIGFSSSNYDELVINYLKGKSHKISFLGRMSFEGIVPYLQKCCFTILSSEIYDNFPNSVLESFAYKKAVIATDIGSLKEMVENEETGLLFEYRNSSDLRNKVMELFTDKEKAKRLGENGFNKLNDSFSKEDHVNKLINLFENLK